MFLIKRSFLYILFVSFILMSALSAYSYDPDLYNGRVKYGSYHCVKGNETCDFESFEGCSKMSGRACPFRDRNITYEEYNKNVADFLNSEYCTYTPTKVKKYSCKYDVGSATIFVKDGNVISATPSQNVDIKDLQDLFKPDKCIEKKMQGDNGEPVVNRHHPSSEAMAIPKTTKEDVNYVPESIQQTKIREETTAIVQPTTEETDSVKQTISSLQSETEALKKEISLLKDQNDLQKQSSNYQMLFLAIVFIMALIAIFRTNGNNNPYKRL